MRGMLHCFTLFMACLPMLVLSGCWSIVELNDRAFARIMLLDYSDQGVQMSLGFPLPNRIASNQPGGGGAGGPSAEPFTYVTKTGGTLGDAYRQIQADLSRRITFGQLRHVVIGRKFAEHGVEPIVDFFARIPNIHINANLFITEGKARQFTEIPVIFERFPTDILTRFVKDQVTVQSTIKDLLMALYREGDFIIPMLVFGREGAETEKKGENWVGTNGAAVLKGGKMADTLNAGETRGAMWIKGDLKNSAVDIASPKDGKNISFNVDRTSTKVTANVNGTHIRIGIRCEGDARVIMSNSKLDFSEPGRLRQVEKHLAEELEERIKNAIGKSKETKSDAFQLGRYVEWQAPRAWKALRSDWRETYAGQVKVVPNVRIHVKWFGAVRKPDWNRLSPNGAEEWP